MRYIARKKIFCLLQALLFFTFQINEILMNKNQTLIFP
jgi:hypothetical protein